MLSDLSRSLPPGAPSAEFAAFREAYVRNHREVYGALRTFLRIERERFGRLNWEELVATARGRGFMRIRLFTLDDYVKQAQDLLASWCREFCAHLLSTARWPESMSDEERQRLVMIAVEDGKLTVGITVLPFSEMQAMEKVPELEEFGHVTNIVLSVAPPGGCSHFSLPKELDPDLAHL